MDQVKFYLSALTFLTLGYALQGGALYDYSPDCPECQECVCEPTYDQCGHATVFGEYLYWNVMQDQMAYAADLPGGLQGLIEKFSGDTVTINETFKFKEPSFNWQSGLRAGLGYEGPCNGWDIEVVWTRLHQHESDHVSDSADGIIPINIPTALVFTFINNSPLSFGFGNKATSQWHFEFDTIDLQIGRNAAFLCDSSFHPFVGVKGVFIRQMQKVSYFGFSLIDTDNPNLSGPVDVQIKKKNHFHAVGPTFGLDTSWKFFNSLSLSSGVCFGLVYGKFHTSAIPLIGVGPNSFEVNGKFLNRNRIRPTLDAYLGLDWQWISCYDWSFNIGAAYEVQYWWNQWQAPSSLEFGTFGAGAPPQGDLVLHGLTVHLGFAF